MLAFKEQKCINCGNNPKGAIVALKEGNVIEATCLQEIQKLVKDANVDQALVQFYGYIINMVLKCMHCGSNLNPNSKNATFNGKYPTCEKCFLLGKGNIFAPIKKKQSAQCFQCEKVLEGIHLIRATVVDGLYICIVCMEGQPSKKIELKSPIKPEPLFVEKKNVNKFLHKEASMPNFLTSESSKSFRNEIRFETIKCQKCRKKLKGNNFTGLSGDHFICNDCKAIQALKQKANKKGRKIVEGGLGLAELFYMSEDEEDVSEAKIEKVEKKQEKKVLIFEMKEVQEAKEEKVERLTIPEQLNIRKSTIYQLKECKLCFNAESAMINVKCRHLMMCERCLNLLKQKHNKKDEIPCPVCATVGKYQLYIEPIYT